MGQCNHLQLLFFGYGITSVITHVSYPFFYLCLCDNRFLVKPGKVYVHMHYHTQHLILYYFHHINFLSLEHSSSSYGLCKHLCVHVIRSTCTSSIKVHYMLIYSFIGRITCNLNVRIMFAIFFLDEEYIYLGYPERCKLRVRCVPRPKSRGALLRYVYHIRIQSVKTIHGCTWVLR